MNAARILLAEDHPMMAEAIRDVLEDEFEVVDTVADGHALVEAAGRLEPDIIITDVSMPLLSGFEAARQVKRAGLHTKIIFVTMHAHVALAQEAFRAGASGYLLKQSVASELVAAIREVLKGNRYISPQITGDPTAFLKELENRTEQQDR